MARKRIYSVLLALLITITGFGPLFVGTQAHATENNLGTSLGASTTEETKFQLLNTTRQTLQKKTYEYTIYQSQEGLFRNLLFPDGKELGEDIFTHIKLMINGMEVSENTMIEYQDGMQIELVYDWELPDDLDLEYADWARIKVPDIFQVDGFLVGTLYFEKEEIGSYYFDEDNYLFLVFNEVLIEKEQRQGQAGFALEFVLKEFADDTVQQIEFGDSIGKSFTIGLKPKGESFALTKGLEKTPEINGTFLEWFVDVNTTLDTLTSGKVKDIIPEGLQLEEGSLQIIELLVGLEGKLTLGDAIQNFEMQATAQGFEIDLGETNKAYRIKYRTQINDYSFSEYRNLAFLYDSDEEKNAAEFVVDKLETGSIIEKSGAADDENFPSKITWTIDINQAETQLEEVVIHDKNFHDWLTVAPESIRIYELVKNDTNWDVGADVSQTFLSDKGFPVALGDINGEAYRIVFDTTIAFEFYQKQTIFDNTAVLTSKNQTEESTATVTVNRPDILRKFGDEITSYQDDVPVILWTVYLNEARQILHNPVLSDTMPEGLELVFDSIQVLDSGWDQVPMEEYTLEETENGFILYFNKEISDYYKIEYKALIRDLEQETFINKAQLNAPGIGQGSSAEAKRPVSPFITNAYYKDTVWETVVGTDYHGVDYQAKTMSWKVTVDAKKEVISTLTIHDEFLPGKTMKLLEDSLLIVKSGNSGDKTLGREEYTLTDNGVNGFVIEFQGELERAKYEIYYKTSFDINKVLDANGTTNNTSSYTNRATFSGETWDSKGVSHPLDIKQEASYSVHEAFFNSGYKTGKLFREKRSIQWEAFFNMQGQNLSGHPYVISDTLDVGQVLLPDSLEVLEYSLTKKGTPSIGEKVASSQYKTEINEEQNSVMSRDVRNFPIEEKD